MDHMTKPQRLDRKYQSSVKELSMKQYYMENYDNTSNSAFILVQGPSSNSKILEVQIACLVRQKLLKNTTTIDFQNYYSSLSN